MTKKKAPIVKQANTNVYTDINLTPQDNRMRLGGYSLPGLNTFQGRIYEEARKELRFPESIKLYKQMLLDPNIATATSLIEMLIGKVPWKVWVKEDAPEQEHSRAKMINYSLHTMERPWEDYITEALSFLTFGFHVSEKIYSQLETPYGSYKGLKDLVTVSQDTIDKWIFDVGDGALVGLRQDLNRIISDAKSRATIKGASVDIPRKKFILFRHNAKRNNPEGTSPLRSVYVSWKYRNLVEEYETVGISKDLGGIVGIGVDVSYLAKASADPTSNEASVLAELKAQAASLVAGEQSYVITPIAYDQSGKPLFTFELKGVEGSSGKQYDTDLVVKRHDSKILMAFFADVLKLGNDGSGSFALADSKTNLLSLGIESHLRNIAKTLNHDVIPQIYKLNGWEYDPENSCKFLYGDVEKQDLEKVAQFIQKTMAVGAIRPTEKLESKLRNLAFADMNSVEEDEDVVLPTENTSKSGVGLEEGLPDGQGTSTSTGGDRNTGAASK